MVRQTDRLTASADPLHHALADEPGQAAIYSVAEAAAVLDGLANPHERSLWMLLNAQDRFRHYDALQ
jgi:hypothetical protein